MRPAKRTVRHINSSWQKPLGWQRGEGHVVIRNPRLGGRGVSVLHVGWMDGDKELYDQIVLIEPVGVVCFVVHKRSARFVLVRSQRILVQDAAAYRRDLADVDPALLGCMVWELPRGLPKDGETLEDTARREAEEETGRKVLSVERLPFHVSLNSTYQPQRIPCCLVMVGDEFVHETDPLEGIDSTVLISVRDYNDLLLKEVTISEGVVEETVDATVGHCLHAIGVLYPMLVQ